MEELKDIIANNLTEYRKAKGMTQLDVAGALNYSDKAVSKWERGESFPDITVLKQLADLYGVTVDDFLQKERKEPHRQSKIGKLLRRHKLIIPFLSAGLVWLVATVVFVFLTIFQVDFKNWLAFMYAVPCSLIVLLVFNAIWGDKILSSILVSALVWTVILSITLSLVWFDGIWMLMLIGIPLQILVILWYVMRIRRAREKG